MGTFSLKGQSLHTYGSLPEIGEKAPNFVATKPDLSTVSLEEYANKCVLINVYPSIDTSVCFDSVKTFQKSAGITDNLVTLCISMDLPFALNRIAKGSKLDDIILLSDFRNREFGELFGLTIADGSLAGLLARAVIVLDKNHHVIHSELVSDISSPPDYKAALQSLDNI
ncbi:MAG: thiol peroxidase [Legionellaceae bacterium]|nr:thiol peroxidase [Legionellaceae bacterium]